MTHMLLALSLSLAAAVPVITLERTVCFGACPAYKVTIFDDGAVVYEGREYVKHKGKAEGRITKDALAELVREFDRINYFSLDDYYSERDPKNCPESWTDYPSATTSLNWKGKTKKIEHYYGCRGLPVLDELSALERTIDQVADTKRWIE